MAQQSLPPFSETVKLAWRLAAEEAVHAGCPQIELPHLLLGVFGVDRVIREEAVVVRRPYCGNRPADHLFRAGLFYDFGYR